MKPAAAKTVDLIHELGADALLVKADVSREAEARNMVEQTVAHYGRWMCSSNNAGVEQGVELIEHEPSRNGTGGRYPTSRSVPRSKYGIRAMLKTGGGGLLTTASISGIMAQNSLTWPTRGQGRGDQPHAQYCARVRPAQHPRQRICRVRSIAQCSDVRSAASRRMSRS